MQNIIKLHPTQTQTHPQILQWIDDLPEKPFCSPHKGYCQIRTKKTALKYKYIQPNVPMRTQWLWFDYDDVGGVYAWSDADLPPPQLIIRNPENAHAHIGYRLNTPVYEWGKSHIRPILYKKAIYEGMRSKMNADRSYAGNLIKNPLHFDWDTYIIPGTIGGYELGDLADFVDLPPYKFTPRRELDVEGAFFGRNCELFDKVRFKAYAMAMSDFDLFDEIYNLLWKENQNFENPLCDREIGQIASSISKYCSSPRFMKAHDDFRAKQAIKGAKGGAAHNSPNGGLARSQKYDDKRQLAIRYRQEGLNNTQIAEKLGVARLTVVRWLK